MIEAPIVFLSHWLFRERQVKNCQAVNSTLLGHSLSNCTFGEQVTLLPELLERHAYLLGTTGSGKTNLILKLLEQDVARRHTAVVVDLRGDLVERTLSLLAHMKVNPNRVTLLDLREREQIVGFNPLAGSSEPFIRALHLLDVVRSEADSWGVQLEETLRNALILLAGQQRSLTDLEQLLFDETLLDTCLAACDEPAVTAFFERYRSLSEERQLSFALPVLNKVTPLLATEGLRCVLGAPNPIDLDRVLSRRGSILLVALAVDELHRSSRMLGALFVSAISRAMFARVRVAESDRNPVRLYVDEFEAMATESFESLIAEGRRFKLQLVLSHQNLAQVPPKLRSVIRNNVGLQGLFRCGFGDALDLARELPDGFTIEDLTSMEPGEVLLMPRGKDSLHLQCSLSDRRARSDEVQAFKRDVYGSTAMARSDVLDHFKRDRPSNARFDSIQRPWGVGGEE